MGIIDRLIEAIENQDFEFSYEVIFLVTESTDGTEEFLRKTSFKHKKIISIPAVEFSHSSTRMLGVENARGNQVIFFYRRHYSHWKKFPVRTYLCGDK